MKFPYPGSGKLGLAMIAAMLLSGCAVAPNPGHDPRPSVSSSPAASPVTASSPADPRTPGRLGTYSVGRRKVTFTEPAHVGVTGEHLGPRKLVTQLFFPRAAVRRFPLLVFGPGFMQCGGPYRDLLKAWASAGYVVAVVNFPKSDCATGSAATESDMVNQPHDMSVVITRLLALNKARSGFYSGLINPAQIGATGQSDGGDTVAAIGANACCVDRRIAAIAVLSGSKWPPFPGSYFASRPVPMLFTQGSADTINPPGCSVILYQDDPARARYYLDLYGADHTTPYWGINKYERVTARVTTAFFDRYLLGDRAAVRRMRHAGTVPGLAALFSAGAGQFPSRYCNV